IPWVSIPVVLLYSFVRATFRPFFSKIINDQIPSEKRATIFSLEGIVVVVFAMIFETLAGYLANQTSIPHTYLVVSGLFTLVCIVPLFIWTKTISRRDLVNFEAIPNF
ncbi:MAG: hypothetical protein ACFFCQ_16220, partial [Promethearchaeota archaeon]